MDMNADIVKAWLVPISTFITLITASIGGWLALREYRLKVQAETRLAHSAELEEDIKLLKLFTEMMNLAHARGDAHVSEKAIERILTPEMFKEFGLSGSNLRGLLESAVIVLPVGAAAQDAAICAIWVLGKRHSLLKPVAIQALESLKTFKGQVVESYLEDLKQLS
jgi:hypothetical protein